MKKTLALLALSVVLSSCARVEKRSRASEMIRLIEDYREQEKELPPYLPELEKTNIHYRLDSDSTYTLWYSTGAGKVEVYHSLTGEWETQESDILQQ